MWLKLSRHKPFLAILAGVMTFLAFPRWEIVPTIFLLPLFLNLIALRAPSVRAGFGYGFLCSFVIMLGGFYWVTYVLHEFGYLSWPLSTLLYMGFCGFGALNFPLFTAISVFIYDRWKPNRRLSPIPEIWFSLGLPSIFTLLEYLVPKLFPWSISHSLYRTLWLTQIAELTGTTFLTFAIFSLGSVLGAFVLPRGEGFARLKRRVWFVPLSLWTLAIGFSLVRLYATPVAHKPFQIALIQANIGSLEKVAARRGERSRVEHVLHVYEELTESALKHNPPPQLIIWPETAMPFQLQSPAEYPTRVRSDVVKWKTPLITGGYAPGETSFYDAYNAAILLDPQPDGMLRMDEYHKNILLAFGEYMPLGETFPSLYKMFPTVSNFLRGDKQNSFLLHDGTKLGVTICYEDIVPSFYRKVAQPGVQAIVNITNDSWFGPTAEPYLHGALTIFRAIETRVPLFRVTNTGISFVVDDRGKMSETTGVYREGVVENSALIPIAPPRTVYTRYGDWFVWVCLSIQLILSMLIFKSRHASLSF